MLSTRQYETRRALKQNLAERDALCRLNSRQNLADKVCIKLNRNIKKASIIYFL